MNDVPGQESILKVRISPFLREALHSQQAGEDFDEALLRALKAQHPERAAPLLSAITRLIEIEGKREEEHKEQTISRLAGADPGPEIELRTSSGQLPPTISEKSVIRINGQEYHSLDEVPAHLRPLIEKALRGETGPRKAGCLSVFLGGWLVALWRR